MDLFRGLKAVAIAVASREYPIWSFVSAVWGSRTSLLSKSLGWALPWFDWFRCRESPLPLACASRVGRLFECSLKFTLGTLLASIKCAPLFLDPILFPWRPSNLSKIAWVRFFIIASILVSWVPRVCSCLFRSCSRSALNRISLFSAFRVVRDKFLAKCSSVFPLERF